jgi:serine protease Do/serine protease DegQ
MLKRVMPGVVNISTRSRVKVQENPLLNDPFFRRFFNIPDQQQPREREAQSLGSGVVVDADKGYILTNNHVVGKADEITVTLRDGRSLSAKVVGTDPEADIAVIKVEADHLTALPFGNSDSLQVGDFVVAIGNPFGLGQTVTSGIVSALGRTGLGIEGYEDFIQTDASINPGNSGGALVNYRGELVGINTAILGSSGNIGIGFAIPSNMARTIMDQLVRYGEVRRGQLGVYIQDVTPELADALKLSRSRGAVITQVQEDSPAAQAGIVAGDVVVSINGEPVRNAAQLRNAVGLLPVGSKVELEILRDGKTHTLTAKIEKPVVDKEAGADISERLSGATLGAIQPNHPLAGRTEGVQVLDVEQGSAAFRAGLRKGDIIVSVNQRAVSNVDDVKKAAKLSDRGILLNIRRGNGALFLVIR